jgi:hypothetical protein
MLPKKGKHPCGFVAKVHAVLLRRGTLVFVDFRILRMKGVILAVSLYVGMIFDPSLVICIIIYMILNM